MLMNGAAMTQCPNPPKKSPTTIAAERAYDYWESSIVDALKKLAAEQTPTDNGSSTGFPS